jgi:hypothetical protein
MIQHDKARWRVFFTDGTPPRDVTATSAEAAKRTALYAERVTGNRTKRLRVLSAERLWAVGWQTQRTLFAEGPNDERS